MVFARYLTTELNLDLSAFGISRGCPPTGAARVATRATYSSRSVRH
jgi:hypothetical protein